MKKLLILIVISTATLILVQSCARMGAPDGGWYDETPPRVVGAVPADRAFNVDNGKVRIYFKDGKKQAVILMSTDESNETSVIVFTGTFKIEDIQKMTEK